MALVALTCGALLAIELVNSAIEQTLDALHPDYHPGIGKAKDRSAGAVLVLAVTAVLIWLALAFDTAAHDSQTELHAAQTQSPE